MTANEILISAIGLFFLFTGISFYLQLRKKEVPKFRERVVAVSLVAVGIIVAIAPFVYPMLSRVSAVGNESADESELLGPEAYEKEMPVNPQKYAEASAEYVRGVGLWNKEINGFDSTDQAMKYLSNSIALFPTAEAHTARGQLNMQLSDMRGALDDLSRAIELNPEFGNAWFNRATIHFIMGNKTSACEDLRKAEELNVPGAADAILSVCN